MADITAQTIATRARLVINDVLGTRWIDSEVLDWVNAGEAAIAAIEPIAYVVTETLTLVAGTKQVLPTAGISLVDVVRNMGTDGNTPGDVVDSMERKVLDSLRPSWHSEATDASVLLFIHNPRDPSKFYVYPPQPASGFGQIEVEYLKVPPALTSLSDALNLRDLYQEALLNYVLFRMYSKESKDGDKSLAETYYSAFIAAVGARTQSERTIDSSEG